jgi:nitrite reductase/ring-hydroxylating ferredoxin subunit
MSKFIKAIKANEIAPGGMKAVEVDGHEIVVCNADGKYYAIERRCGHTNAPLDKGTLDGVILTCAMHSAQFDITTGEALSGPVPHDPGGETIPPKLGEYLNNIGKLMHDIRTHSIHTYLTSVKAGSVMIEINNEK